MKQQIRNMRAAMMPPAMAPEFMLVGAWCCVKETGPEGEGEVILLPDCIGVVERKLDFDKGLVAVRLVVVSWEG
jgi:hypothetical protein